MNHREETTTEPTDQELTGWGQPGRTYELTVRGYNFKVSVNRGPSLITSTFRDEEGDEVFNVPFAVNWIIAYEMILVWLKGFAKGEELGRLKKTHEIRKVLEIQ